MKGQKARPLSRGLRDTAGFPEAVAVVLTAVVFVVSYILESRNVHNEMVFRAIFLVGAVILCGTVTWGVLVRYYVPVISHLVVLGAVMIGISQTVGLLETVPSLAHVPLIGRSGPGYLVHLDDMLLYPGFLLMLCGFYMSVLHGSQLRARLEAEAQLKESALQESQRSAEALARRVAFENLVNNISTRFINVDQDEVDQEIRLSLQAVGEFAEVDRAHFLVSRTALCEYNERFEWCGQGIESMVGAVRRVAPRDFPWILGTLEQGKAIRVNQPGELPESASAERAWLQRFGIQSLLCVPIISRGSLRGYIALDGVDGCRQWPEEMVPLLRMIGEILLSAWERRCVARQRALLELQVQQAQKMESLGVMAGGIAHDFNNILTGIMGNAELAQLSTAPGDERRRYLEGVTQSARRAAELCRQMLAYAGRGRFVTEEFCLNALITDMMPLLRATVSRTASFESHLMPDLPAIEGDVAQFRQVLVNLVTNASESLEDRGSSVVLETGLRHCDENFLLGTHLPEPLPAGDYVYLEVRDTGCGMSDEVVKRIFDPFFTTRFTGRGLGLPAVLGIVRGHKGAIELDTRPGKGTRIRLYFPMQDTAAKYAITPGEVLGGWHGHGTVLLADDEEMVLSVGAMMLKHLGLDVVVAPNAEEALERALEQGGRLQCVILDMNMPGMDGDATCAAFKDRLPEVPIVIASGYMREDIEGTFAPGRIAAFLAKPFELFNIQAVLREVLDRVPRH